jgi:hypothetical protein
MKNGASAHVGDRNGEGVERHTVAAMTGYGLA